MPDPLTKVRPGQPLRIPAAAYNAFVDAISGLTLSPDTDPTANPHQWKRHAAGKVTPATFGYATLTAGGDGR